MRERHGRPRRVNAELVDLHKRRANRLRRDACHELWRAMWLAVMSR